MNESGPSPSKVRYRIWFAKTHHMRFTSHLDLHHTLERCFRRARMPLAYSQGFNPRLKINLSPALPLGYTSECELVDVWLKKEIPTQDTLRDLNLAAPDGLQFSTIEAVTDPQPSLQTQVVAVVYECTVDPAQSLDDLEASITSLMDAEELPRVRRGKEYDLRRLIEDIQALPSEQGLPKLRLQLTTLEGATGRPEEVMDALELDPTHVLFHRTKLIRSRDQVREEFPQEAKSNEKQDPNDPVFHTPSNGV